MEDAHTIRSGILPAHEHAMPWASPSPFDRIALGSFAITAAVGLTAVALNGFRFDAGVFVPITAFTFLIGFVHNATGALFLAAAPAVRSQFRRRPLLSSFTALAAVGLSLPFYSEPRLLPAAAILFYAHAAENSAYQIQRLAIGAERPRSAALFPLIVALVIVASVPQIFAGPHPAMQSLALAASIGAIAAWLPRTDWSAGWILTRRNPLLLALFGLGAIFVRDSNAFFYLFVLWHYLTWIAYTWVRQPEARRRLVALHLAFGIPYAVLVGATLASPRLLGVGLVWALISPMGFMAQSMTHVFVSGALRHYPAGEA